jgi:hypothetical protein
MGIATMNEVSWLDSHQGQEIFNLLKTSRQNLGPTYPPMPLVLMVLSQGPKRPGHETDHCRCSESVEVHLLSPFTFIVCFFIKHRGMYTLLMN